MDTRIVGQVKRVNGPIIEARGITDALMQELVQVGEARLTGEIIKLQDGEAIIQVYEDTTGIAPGHNIYGTGAPLSVELGPGLIGTIYDGIQRPLVELEKISGLYIEKGISRPSLNREKSWPFVPELKEGDRVAGGMIFGSVQESQRINHKLLVPPEMEGVLKSIKPSGEYTVEDDVAVVQTDSGKSL